MHLDLSGKVALVTGSYKGIGFGIAQTLHTEGCLVALNGRNSKGVSTATAKLFGSIGVVGDVTKTSDAQRLVAEVVKTFGRLDILVCCVGSGRSVPPGKENANEWNRVFATNLWSVTNIVEAAQEALTASKGVIVCISSICGVEVIDGAPITYSAAKAALNAYVRGISRPLGKEGVRINAIALGNILFEDSVWSHKLVEDKLAVFSMLKKEVSLDCFGSLTDVASLV
jgi:NAD(P)-dependent dehydrogenase (short-subunit alcohol dehydrogenase family)